MSNIEASVADTANAGSVKADWAQLATDLSEVVVEPKVEPVIEPEKKPEEIVIEPKVEPIIEPKIEPTPEETAKLAEEAKIAEIKELGLPETATQVEIDAAKLAANTNKPLEFKIDDIQNIPQTYTEGTFQALAKDVFGIDLPTESLESFKESFVPRAEFDKVQNVTIDTLLSTLRPEAATAIKLIQMGIPEEQVFAPTRSIDYHLSLDDVALVRADLELQKDLTPEIIDNKMELLSAEPHKLKVTADELRVYLNRAKTDILENGSAILQKYEQDKQNATLHQKQLERTQVTNELNKVQSFMGVPISKEVTEAFIRKYNNGLYDNDLNNPASKAQFILQKEMQEKLTKHIQNKAFEKVIVEQRAKDLNIPPIIGGAAQMVDVQKQPITNQWEQLVNELKT